jgi:hypothetical protein
MSILDIAVVFVAVIAIVVAYQLSGIRSEIHRATGLLQSLDQELFHIAQEQNPQYGSCSRCGRRAVVRHVLPRDGEPDPNSPDMFYCQPCWWSSSTVRAGDDVKYYKDRLTKRDVTAANAGPG